MPIIASAIPLCILWRYSLTSASTFNFLLGLFAGVWISPVWVLFSSGLPVSFVRFVRMVCQFVNNSERSGSLDMLSFALRLRCVNDPRFSVSLCLAFLAATILQVSSVFLFAGLIS